MRCATAQSGVAVIASVSNSANAVPTSILSRGSAGLGILRAAAPGRDGKPVAHLLQRIGEMVPGIDVADQIGAHVAAVSQPCE